MSRLDPDNVYRTVPHLACTVLLLVLSTSCVAVKPFHDAFAVTVLAKTSEWVEGLRKSVYADINAVPAVSLFIVYLSLDGIRICRSHKRDHPLLHLTLAHAPAAQPQPPPS